MKEKPMKIFCLKCRKNRTAVNPRVVKTANGKLRVSAKCSKCGTELSSFRPEYIRRLI